MADVSIMRTIQDYSGRFWNRTSGSVLYPNSILKVGPLGPRAGEARAEGPELGYGAPGATYAAVRFCPTM